MLKIALSREKPALFPKREFFASKKIPKHAVFVRYNATLFHFCQKRAIIKRGSIIKRRQNSIG